MTPSLSAFIHPRPCCAHLTPTRTSGWRAALARVVERLNDARKALAQRLQSHERLLEFDAAMLRDLGLSHTRASWTPHERYEGPWR